MQSVLMYGRLFSRAFVNGVINVTSSGQSTNNSQTANSSSISSPSLNTNENSSTSSSTILEGKKNLKFITAVSGFPKYEPSPLALDKIRAGKFGDDAYFLAKHAKGQVLGVADGVGGWRAWGIDPGEFSYGLMHTCERLIQTGSFNPSEPAAIIAAAYYELLENKTAILGSSTACVVILQGSFGRLFSANIGDSGFLVIRDGCVVHRSQEQQHYFNTPFQLSLPPPGVSAHVLSDRPESASTQTFDMKVGDMLLLATDGVFDNLPDSLILRELGSVAGTTDTSRLQEAANAIAIKARNLAFDELYMSPFALSARKNGIDATGGKPDDITVILASVMG